MNPTDEVDDLLTRAGARWRADQPSPPEPDLEHLLTGGRRPRRWVPALAAASVAVIAAAALTVFPGGDKGTAPSTTGQTVAEGNQAPNDDLLVRDGDMVEVGGQVIVAPGQDVVFCAPYPQPLPEPPAKRPAPSCPAEYAVKLKGFDVDKLAEPKTIDGVRTGYTTVTGVWSNRTIDVQHQTVPQTRSTTAELNLPPDVVPCPAPAGGWKPGPSDVDKIAVVKFLDARQNEATDPRVLYPKGHALGAPEVYTIGVAHGDLAVFRAAFEKVYDGNLCVHPVKFSQAELTQLSTTVANLIPKGHGVWASGPAGVDKIGVSALVYDEALKNALTPVGLDNLELEVAVKPVR